MERKNVSPRILVITTIYGHSHNYLSLLLGLPKCIHHFLAFHLVWKALSPIYLFKYGICIGCTIKYSKFINRVWQEGVSALIELSWAVGVGRKWGPYNIYILTYKDSNRTEPASSGLYPPASTKRKEDEENSSDDSMQKMRPIMKSENRRKKERNKV